MEGGRYRAKHTGSMAAVFLLILFFGLGLGIVVCLFSQEEMGKPWIFVWSGHSYVWLWGGHESYAHVDGGKQRAFDFFAWNIGKYGPGICHGRGHAKAVSCQILGLQQEPPEPEWIYLPVLLVWVGAAFSGTDKNVTSPP